MLGCADQGFVAISAMALNAAISGSILAEPDACFVMMMALPFGSTGVANRPGISFCPPCRSVLFASLRSAVSIVPDNFQP